MSLSAHLIHQAVIERGTEHLDAYGDNVPEWGTVWYGRCRLVEKQERVWNDVRAESAVVTRYLLLLPVTADVDERDRVTVNDVVYTVTARLTRNTRVGHHFSVDLQVVA
jgi:hypothetical protein